MTTFEEAFGELRSNRIYFDNAATTAVLPEVYDKMEPFLRPMFYGNPSSKYTLGEVSKRAIDEAREIIADIINCNPEEIYFTSGGSESNSWVIKGLKNPYKFNKMHIITSNIEHHSISSALSTRMVMNNDIDITYAASDKNGIIQEEIISDAIKLNTRLCSIQMVNNELGTVQHVKEVAYKCRDNGVLFHTDAVQAFGHTKIDVQNMGIDLMSVSGHKFGAPKGVGFLYISEAIKPQMYPLINGGQQERGLRGSTENVASIVGMGKAAEIASRNMKINNEICQALSLQLTTKLVRIPGVHLNCNPRYTDYRHINIRIDGIRSEELMALLDTVHVYVSSGSACNSDSKEPSHVLKAIGLSDEEANSSIRISINENNTAEEIALFVHYLEQFIPMLRRK